MTTLNCKSVCMAAMAIADGSPCELSSVQIEVHLEDCFDCSREVGQMRELFSLLDRHERRDRTENVWKQVERRLPEASTERSASQSLRPFMLLGVLLLGYRLVEMIPDRDLGVLFNLVPLLFVVAAFSYIRENPFKINSALRLEGERQHD